MHEKLYDNYKLFRITLKLWGPTELKNVTASDMDQVSAKGKAGMLTIIH